MKNFKYLNSRRKFLIYASTSVCVPFLHGCGGDNDKSSSNPSTMDSAAAQLASVHAASSALNFNVLSLRPANFLNSIDNTMTQLYKSIGSGGFSNVTLVKDVTSGDTWGELAVLGETATLAFTLATFPDAFLLTGILTTLFNALNSAMSGGATQQESYSDIINRITAEKISSSNLSSLTSLITGIDNTLKDYETYLQSISGTSSYSSSQSSTLKTKETTFSDSSCETNLPQFINSNVGVSGAPLYAHVAACQLMANYEFLANSGKMDKGVLSSSDAQNYRNESVNRFYRHQNALATLVNNWVAPLNTSSNDADAAKKFNLLNGLIVNGLSEFYQAYKTLLMTKYGSKIKTRNSVEIYRYVNMYINDTNFSMTNVEAALNRDLVSRTSLLTNLNVVGHQGTGDPAVLRIAQSFVDGTGNLSSFSVETCTGNPPSTGTTIINSTFPTNQFSTFTVDGTDIPDSIKVWNGGSILHALNISYSNSNLPALISGQTLSGTNFPISCETGYYIGSIITYPRSASATCSANSGEPVNIAAISFRHWSSVEHIAKVNKVLGVEVDLTCGFDKKNSSPGVSAYSDSLVAKSVINIPSGSSIVFNINNTETVAVNVKIVIFAGAASSNQNSTMVVNGQSTSIPANPTNFHIGLYGRKYAEIELPQVVSLNSGTNSIKINAQSGGINFMGALLFPVS
ncbi:MULTISPECIES: insecticidal delta-endotoxin Cry8Ea1 family protein [Burkholderia cepacia complex]|uniref:insecticidal delta-endotoxin Cry8Ea1 family protein n=1 Tax=Burkholderia cepacia complex TaxID=87882 RepID=UPI000B2C015F|nr:MULTISPECIES: insecticidal delta-endotoxin Cry8Ea1 family protein [Burkholderia cepacia complex]